MLNSLLCNDGSKPKRKTFKLEQFARNEDGAFTIFVLFMVVLMLAITGMAMDVMKYERDRASLQSTLDRAVLAAADLDQDLPAKAVVDSYMDKAGLGNLNAITTVVEGFGSKKVSATAEAVVPTRYLRFGKVTELGLVATSAAEESIGAVEISLILDISGSMSRSSATPSKTKIAVLREAASEFVRLMLDKPNETQISISIVPYATQVNAGASILDKFTNVTQEHSYSHCVNFIPEQYSDSDLERDDTLERTAHFDPFTYSEGTIDLPVCPVRAGSAITPVTDNMNKLLAQIASLTPGGNTSIDIGMKWGTALLDPSMRGIVRDLSLEQDPSHAGTTIVPSKFSVRPSDYGTDVLKIAIVMTDGQNTDQYMLNPSLREGMSDVWYNPEADEYTVYHSQGRPNFFWPQQDVWADHPYGNPEPETQLNEEPGTAVRLSYPELFNRVSLAWNARYNYYWQSSGWAEWYSKAYAKVETSAKNQRTKHICDAAKDQGIIVYGIAFEAPRSGYRTLKDCASSDSHVYDVSGLNLEKAFESIASSIRKLRLTQ
ncbi:MULTISPECIES: TadE/TadG family type IV pilus assembly protein [unclassified Ruegeria]|uniref:TadE/TadG family type IV pilus assembly protein n=1 Tax=unclassified Ruegeria TaxID=2625375 RepID=UPI001AEB139A|nr:MULTISPECIES: TadE/TadG family type IV pilus assembly protein [unclassified Ruegeria]